MKGTPCTLFLSRTQSLSPGCARHPRRAHAEPGAPQGLSDVGGGRRLPRRTPRSAASSSGAPAAAAPAASRAASEDGQRAGRGAEGRRVRSSHRPPHLGPSAGPARPRGSARSAQAPAAPGPSSRALAPPLRLRSSPRHRPASSFTSSTPAGSHQ